MKPLQSSKVCQMVVAVIAVMAMGHFSSDSAQAGAIVVRGSKTWLPGVSRRGRLSYLLGGIACKVNGGQDGPTSPQSLNESSGQHVYRGRVHNKSRRHFCENVRVVHGLHIYTGRLNISRSGQATLRFPIHEGGYGSPR